MHENLKVIILYNVVKSSLCVYTSLSSLRLLHWRLAWLIWFCNCRHYDCFADRQSVCIVIAQCIGSVIYFTWTKCNGYCCPLLGKSIWPRVHSRYCCLIGFHDASQFGWREWILFLLLCFPLQFSSKLRVEGYPTRRANSTGYKCVGTYVHCVYHSVYQTASSYHLLVEIPLWTGQTPSWKAAFAFQKKDYSLFLFISKGLLKLIHSCTLYYIDDHALLVKDTKSSSSSFRRTKAFVTNVWGTFSVMLTFWPVYVCILFISLRYKCDLAYTFSSTGWGRSFQCCAILLICILIATAIGVLHGRRDCGFNLRFQTRYARDFRTLRKTTKFCRDVNIYDEK